MRFLQVVFLTLQAFALAQGTSMPFFKPVIIPNCKADEAVCGEVCYKVESQECLTYDDGSGGTVCAKGDTHCGGKCVTPGSGQVCLEGTGGYQAICHEGQSVCSFSRCYDAEVEDCVNGHTLCPKGEILCGHGGGRCYKPSEDVQCIKGDFNSYLCKSGELLCRGNICYHPHEEICISEERRVCTVGDVSCIHLYNSL